MNCLLNHFGAWKLEVFRDSELCLKEGVTEALQPCCTPTNSNKTSEVNWMFGENDFSRLKQGPVDFIPLVRCNQVSKIRLIVSFSYIKLT